MQLPIRLHRIWPLGFTVLGLIGLVHLAPILYEDFVFMRNGVATYGWYTDLEEQNEFIHYAYQVRDQVFSGQESWDEENSGIYFHHNGEKMEITYREHKPWISRRRWGMEHRWQSSLKWAELSLTLFSTGILLSILPRRSGRDSADRSRKVAYLGPD